MKPAERVTLILMMAEFFVIDADTEVQKKMDALWTTFASQVSIDDVRVRESLIKACSQIVVKNGTWAKKVEPIFLQCIGDKGRVVK